MPCRGTDKRLISIMKRAPRVEKQAMSPNWAEVVAAISSAVVAVTAVIALFLAPQQIRELRRNRRAQVLPALRSQWDSVAMTEARQLVGSFDTREDLNLAVRTAERAGSEELYILMRVPNFWEDLGTLVDVGAADYDTVRRIYGIDIGSDWEHWAPVIAFLRETRGQPSMYEAFEGLATRVAADAASRV